jgi:hypothetical protein
MSRLYAVESLFTLTGANADHRLRGGGEYGWQKLQIEILLQISDPVPLLDFEMDFECAKDLLAQSWRMRWSLPASASRLKFICSPRHQFGARRDWQHGHFASDDGNHGADLKNLDNGAHRHAGHSWRQSRLQFELVAEAKTENGCSAWLLRRRDGGKIRLEFPGGALSRIVGRCDDQRWNACSVQPLIQPLFGGLTELEFLARIAGESQTNPYDIVRTTFAGSEEDWKKFLFNGFLRVPLPNRQTCRLIN